MTTTVAPRSKIKTGLEILFPDKFRAGRLYDRRVSKLTFSSLESGKTSKEYLQKLESLVEDYSGRNIIFIVGCARSGTTWLQQLLASHPRARTGHESYLFSSYIGPQLRAWGKELQSRRVDGLGLGCYLKEDEFLRTVRLYMRLLMSQMIGNLQDDELFIEKTPAHSHYIPEIIKLLPECRIIHIMRDPRDVVASMLAASKSRLGKGWAPEKAGDAARKLVGHVNAIKAAEKQLSANQLYTIRYEDLISSTEEELAELVQFLNIKWDYEAMTKAIERNNPKSANQTATRIPIRGEFHTITGRTYAHASGFVRKAKPGSWKEDLSLTQKIAIWRVARKVMAEEGYPWKYPW